MVATFATTCLPRPSGVYPSRFHRFVLICNRDERVDCLDVAKETQPERDQYGYATE